MKTTPKTLEELLARLRAEQAAAGADLSSAEDLSLAVMNLLSLEEHFFFTAAKTGNNKYLKPLAEARAARVELMKKLLPAAEREGEVWCAAKHLLAAAMRLIEVGTKLQTAGKMGEAAPMFQQAYHLYNIFWSLKLDLTTVKEIKKSGKDLIGELADCCGE